MLIAFIPVIHEGYRKLFTQYPEHLGILGNEIIADYTALTRECRIIDPVVMQRAIDGLGIFQTTQVLTKKDLTVIAQTQVAIVMPDEDISRQLAETYFPHHTVTFVSAFLRWDKMATIRENIILSHRKITANDLAKSIMGIAIAESTKSSDWWRQVGTVIVKDGSILALSHNKHLPTDYHLAVDGDPRSNFNAGERIDLTTAIHSEALAIAQSAKTGTSLNGADAFVSTFPCPNCARLLAEAGIKTVFYHQGYSLLDAEEILKAYGVEIVLVDLANTST